jgi:hypothetical protein
MKIVWMTVLASAALLAAPAAAQVPLTFEARLDAGIPVRNTDELLDAGVGFGIRVAVDLANQLAVYGGYSRMELDYDDGLEDEEVVEDGFELGARVGLGYGHYGSSSPYLLFGALFREDETGIEAGVGADYPVSWNLSVTPEVRYRTIRNLDYLALGLGARVRF